MRNQQGKHPPQLQRETRCGRSQNFSAAPAGKREQGMNTDILKTQERVGLSLRGLYQSYGYMLYKVGKFEEYDLYRQNKKFLASERVITFSDVDGRLLALKPDVTLSIVKNTVKNTVKNARDCERTKKVYYTENVYRVPRNARGFQEIPQVGLECIGSIDAYALAEVVMLAARSLETIGRAYILDVSDVGVLSAILADEPIGDEGCARVLAAVGEKNPHGLSAVCAELSVSQKTESLLKALVSLCGPLDETLFMVERLDLPAACAPALAGLRTLSKMLDAYGVTGVNLDFSVINDMDYYNALVFRGFVDGIPNSVLSGGQYDNLMARMGSGGKAIGFAVYLDQLEHFMEQKPEYDVDTLVVYGDATDPVELIKTTETLRASVPSLRVQREADPALTCRAVVRLDKREGNA